MRILFQGDSITDAGRDKRNYYDLGPGYPSFVGEQIKLTHPELDCEFINLGISGNRTSQLFDRLYTDAIALAPDVISILIGINDLWHRYDAGRIATTDAQFELNYICILERIKRETNAKIIILSPYLLDAEITAYLRPDLDNILPIVERLAEKYADAYVPLDSLFCDAMRTQPAPLYFSADGVHPNENGARFIARHYVEALEKIINS